MPPWRSRQGWLRCPSVDDQGDFFLGFTTRALGDMKDPRRFAAALRKAGADPSSWTGGQQVHGTRVLWTAKPSAWPEGAPRTDGAATARKDLALRVFAADCAPVAVLDGKGRAMALVHAGWRGVQKGILPKTLHLLKRKTGTGPRDARVWIGPCIHPCCYEVGYDVARFFPRAARPRRGAPGKFSLDLPAALRAQAARAGVPAARISYAPHCTACDRRFFSYRRDATPCRSVALLFRRGGTR